MRFRLPALLAGIALVAAGCNSEPTAPNDRTAASDAAQELLHLADSLSANGGSANEVGAYRGLAALLEGTGRLSSVTISVDGAPSEFLATAQEIQIVGCSANTPCPLMLVPPDRFVSAWQKDNPRRMVQLFVPGQSFPTVAGDSAGTAFAAVSDLLFLDGNGALYGGATTSRGISVTVSDTPCAPQDSTLLAIYTASPCRQADFTVAFDGVADLIPLDTLIVVTFDSSGTSSTSSTSTNAAPSHHVTMTQQQVHGAHVESAGLCIDCANPPGTTPPIASPSRDSLTASLTASVGSDVTFTFTVTNAGATAAEMKFNDGQQYDIRVWNEQNTLVWRWGADKGFTQALTARTLAPGASVTYVEHWTPAAAGKYHAMAYLTSSTHGAVGFTNVDVP